jgi:TIR domain-containing protein
MPYLTILTPGHLCLDPKWAPTTNLIHVVLHKEDLSRDEIEKLFPRKPYEFGLTIMAPYAPPRPGSYGPDTPVALLRVDHASIQPYLMGAKRSEQLSAAPLTPIGEGFAAAASFILHLQGAEGAPVRILARVLIQGIIAAEAEIELTTSHMGAKTIASRSSSAFAKIFASYARCDQWVVKAADSIVSTFSLGELRWDFKILRAGENWAERLEEEILTADSFQLFWSQAASASENVRKEWMLALGRNIPGFIKPVYWDEPPVAPPPELAHLHFAWINLPVRPPH